MKFILKFIFILIIAILLITSVYFVFFTGEDKNDKDNEPPVINKITDNIVAQTGDVVTIHINYSDNIGVVNATIYYKNERDTIWNSLSIITGSVNFSIPSDSDEDIYYYVTINDEAGNGPVRSPSSNGSYYTITVAENDDGNGNNQNGDNSHIVFVEEGTATWCVNCPEVASILHELYDPNEPDFYYVSLVEDKSSLAKTRLENDFNFFGFPCVYIDGGYEVIVGPNDFKSKFQQKLTKANDRTVPNLYLNLISEWNETRKEVKNTVLIQNNDTEKYSGILKIYITEIDSLWPDYNGDQYSNTFIDFGYNNEIQVDTSENITISEIWSAPDTVQKENLFIIAVIFNSEEKTGNSDPDNLRPNDDYNFNAHYADAADGVKVTEEEGKSPPFIGIKIPKPKTHYILGNEKQNTLVSKTYIIGKLDLEVNVNADVDIEKVEYSIQGLLREFTETVYEEPYSMTWDTFSFGKYTITVQVYDIDGDIATDSIDVIALIL